MRKKRDVTCGIYKIENVVNGKVYIGQSKNCEFRWLGHVRESSKDKNKSHFYKSIRKYGIDNFKFTILEKVEKEKLNERECYWIWVFKSTYPNVGYNKTHGGEGVKPTAETLVNMSIASKNRNYKASEKTREFLSQKSKNSKWITNGVEEYFKIVDCSFQMPVGFDFGRLPRSEEAKRKTSKTLAVTNKKEDTILKRKLAQERSRETLKGHFVSEETKEKLSKKRKERFKNASVEEKARLSHRGFVCYTNGIDDKLFKNSDNIPDGWYAGKSKTIYINNGEKNMKISQNEEVPCGWFLGFLRKNNKQKKTTH